VLVDRTAPGGATHLTIGDVDAQGNATATWDAAPDPDLPDGSPGSGTKTYAVRYAVNDGDATDIETTEQPSLSLHGLSAGDFVTVEVAATDAVGNQGAAVQLTDVPGPLAAPDDPDETDDGQPGWDDEAAFDALPDGATVPTPPDPAIQMEPAPGQLSSARALSPQARGTLPPLSNNGSQWIAHPDGSTWGSFRNKRQQFFVGSIKDGDSWFVYWQKPGGKPRFNSSWGFFKPNSDAARGGACGWVKVGNIDPADGALHSPHCGDSYGTPPNMGYSISKIAGLINCDACNRGTRVKLTENAQVYRNIVKEDGEWHAVPEDRDAHLDPTSHNRRTDVLEGGKDAFAWRYMTPDGKWLAGYNSFRLKGFHWGFIKTEHVAGSSNLCAAMNGHRQAPTIRKHRDWPDVCDTTTQPGS
jgi:hypothetical protein